MERDFKVYADYIPSIYKEDLIDFVSERVNISKEHCCAALHNFMETYGFFSLQHLAIISLTSCFSYRIIYGAITDAIYSEELPEKFRII